MTPATVYPWEVEPGDLILGLCTPVATVLQTDGKVWIYAGADGTIIARRPHWGRVQVVRQDRGGCSTHSVESISPPTAADYRKVQQPPHLSAFSDDCDPTPPHGIARVHGLYQFRGPGHESDVYLDPPRPA